MLQPNDGAPNWAALIGLAFVIAVFAVVLWQSANGQDVTIGVKGVGQVPVAPATAGS